MLPLEVSVDPQTSFSSEEWTLTADIELHCTGGRKWEARKPVGWCSQPDPWGRDFSLEKGTGQFIRLLDKVLHANVVVCEVNIELLVK